MPFSTIRYEVDEGFGGKVAVEAKQGREGLSAVRITAFGKDVVLTKEQLSKLSSVKWNGMRVVSDVGINGAFVSVQLERGFSSGSLEQVLLLVSSAGLVEILELKRE
jgi:hypothetical protein